jgi:hypothetical protein
MTQINNNENVIKTIAFVTGMVASVIFFTFFLFAEKNSKKSPILLVDVDQLVQDIIKDPTIGELEDSKTAEHFEKTFKKIDSILDDISKKEAKVIINRKAALKGGEDITGKVQKLLLEENK